MFKFKRLHFNQQLILEELFRELDYAMLNYLQNGGTTEALNRAFNLMQKSLTTLRLKNTDKILQIAKGYIGRFTPSLISSKRHPLYFHNIIFVKNHVKFNQVYPIKITEQKAHEIMNEARTWFSMNYFDYSSSSDNPYISQRHAECYDKKITQNTYFYEYKFDLAKRSTKTDNKSVKKQISVVKKGPKSNKTHVPDYYNKKTLNPRAQPSIGNVKIGYGLESSFKAPRVRRIDIKIDQKTTNKDVYSTSILYTPGWSLKPNQDD